MMYHNALTEAGAELYPLLRSFSPPFYLAGGTALALQIGHRISVDFDLFSPHPIPEDQLARAEHVFTPRPVRPLVSNTNELTVSAGEVKVTFLHYPFPVLMEQANIGGVAALSPAEIAAAKAYTIGRRAAYKDYIDLYACLSEEYTTLADIIENANKKYGEQFTDRLFLEQLTYWDDVEEVPISFLWESVSREEMISFFRTKVNEFTL